MENNDKLHRWANGDRMSNLTILIICVLVPSWPGDELFNFAILFSVYVLQSWKRERKMIYS